MPIEINFYTEIISITSPTDLVTVQELVNAIRDAEMTTEGIAFDKIIDAVGKADLGGGAVTGITMALNTDWQIQYWAGVGYGIVKGGNIVGGLGGKPIAATGGSDTILQLGAIAGVAISVGSGLSEEEHDQLMALDTSGIATLQTAVEDILGITGENVKWSAMSFDSKHNLTSATITQYTDNTLVTPRKVWQLTATYNTNSELITYQLTEV